MNIVFLRGLIGRDATRQLLGSKCNLFEFPLGTDEVWGSLVNGARQRVIQWHRIKLYGFPDATFQELKRGTTVLLEGRLVQRVKAKPPDPNRPEAHTGSSRDMAVTPTVITEIAVPFGEGSFEVCHNGICEVAGDDIISRRINPSQAETETASFETAEWLHLEAAAAR